MSILDINPERPNPLVLLANFMDQVKKGKWDQIVIIATSPDSECVSWSSMKMNDLTYANALLTKTVMDELE